MGIRHSKTLVCTKREQCVQSVLLLATLCRSLFV